jgi:predicted kinase
MQAVILIGVQATGKSTYFKERFIDTHVRINLDMLRTRHREGILLNACLQSKQSFVVDNMNLLIEDRKRYILPAKAAHFEVVGYYFQSGISDSLRRNQLRTGRQKILEVGIRAAHNKLQIPTLDEGFDKLYYVKIDSSDSFIVDEWHDEV